MLTISTWLLCDIAGQSPDALATVLANIAIDRSRRRGAHIHACFRPEWTALDKSDDPVLMKAFDYDREFVEERQDILVHTCPDYDFSVITTTISGESEVECLIVGPGFALVTRDLFGSGWHDWNEGDDARLPISDILRAIGR